MKTQKPVDLSDAYWGQLSEQHRALYAIVRPQAVPTYTVDLLLPDVESFLKGLERDMVSAGGRVELEPDFQRGHVLTDQQRTSYVEALIRGNAPKTIQFNCPGWSGRSDCGDIPSHTFQCVDGLQRFTAVRRFVAGEVKVFGGKTVADLRGSPFDARRFTLRIAVHEFKNRSDLLQFYLDLNAGGTVHTQAELERVQALLHAEASGPGAGMDKSPAHARAGQ